MNNNQTNQVIKPEDLIGSESITDNDVVVKGSKHYAKLPDIDGTVSEKVTEFNNRVQQFNNYVAQQRKTNPDYDYFDPVNMSDVMKFGLRWFYYEPDMARVRGVRTTFFINGLFYCFTVGTDILILLEHYPLVKEWASRSTFQNVPQNINNMLNGNIQEIANKIVK